ncbi:MAG: 30S ribosomal protein S15 [Minisyncoccales bacterium]
MLTKEEKKEILEKLGKKEKETGSALFQVILLTKRIEKLIDHLKTHKKDKSSKRGMINLLGKRKKLLKYLQRKKPAEYQQALVFLKEKNEA